MSDQSQGQLLPYSVTCSHCGKSEGGLATDNFAFITATTALGWLIPIRAGIPGSDIKCPTCKTL